MKKIAVFADVQNIYYTSRQAYGKQFNYRKLWQIIEQQGVIVNAFAYAIDRGDNQQKKFQDVLKHLGFEVKLKPYIQRSDGSAKGDWDVGITIDIMEIAKQVDTVILLSGDGDFAILLDKVRDSFGVQTEAYGVPQLTAKALIDSCTVFNPIDQNLLLS
ncbi:NYN domain-containing protein [Psychromonas ossibalaenae]|uniref:NYN domain-containing protein n=1 Tax=Psychromonas ossibalaenae TaxID=444922 RepID=UPI00035C7141|nr:NYN domain-containing protein [Psychromonas ossibalaenae]